MLSVSSSNKKGLADPLPAPLQSRWCKEKEESENVIIASSKIHSLQYLDQQQLQITSTMYKSSVIDTAGDWLTLATTSKYSNE
jgi:hypothetical protein